MNMWGGVEWQIQHEAKLSAVLAMRPIPGAALHRTARVYIAFTDLLGLLGKITRMIASAFSRFSTQLRFETQELLFNAL